MRLVGQIFVTVPNDIVRRDPTLFERLKRGLGAELNLDTAEVQNQLEATVVVEGVRQALVRLGIGNALSLVIDDTVIFQDSDGKADDLPDLVLALAEHASVFGRGFRELRFAAEHEEAGLHLIIETRARTRHRRSDPAAVISVGGRLRELEARPGESAESYRARVEPLTTEPARFETARLAFESFVARLRDALQAGMPEAKVDQRNAEARLIKAPEHLPAKPEQAQREPMHPGYDPFQVYYPSPMGMVLDAMLFASFMHMMMPPTVLITTPMGLPIGGMTDIQMQPELASDDRLMADDGVSSEAHGHGVEGSGGDSDSDSDGFADGGDQSGDTDSGWGGGDWGGFDNGGGFD